MGMTQMKNGPQLTATQFKTLTVALCRIVLSETGEISEYEARTNGCRLDSLRALVAKGELIARQGEFLMPVGPYAGQMVPETFYTIED